ncbi:MAG TPA: tail fiber protein [Candidatus Saccharibacteria bacterium]|nr:tail fiber protein [Candidatus Saccharibacteria bacterium]
MTKKVKKGFTLPTILITSIVLLGVLALGISSTVAVRTAMNDQHYNRIADLAGEAGTAYAKACLEKSNGAVLWTDEKPLKPNTDCSGNVDADMSPYIQESTDLRVYFSVPRPPLNGSGAPISLAGQGFVEVLRSSTGTAWRVWSSSVVSAQSGQGAGVPVGTSIEGYWTTPPEGYLLEDGSAVSRATYANLFNVIGTTFGAGDGSTTFNLPDSRGRVAVNLNSSDSEFNTIGKKSGAKTVTLTEAQMPSHNHTGTTNTAGNHSHSIPNCASCGGSNGNSLESWAGAYSSRSHSTNSAGNHSHSFTTNSSGEGESHPNIQPSIVVTRAIKY